MADCPFFAQEWMLELIAMYYVWDKNPRSSTFLAVEKAAAEAFTTANNVVFRVF